MRQCRKCSKQVSDDSRICRDCGGILEDIHEPDAQFEPQTDAHDEEGLRPRAAGCPRCGSTTIMRGVAVHDAGEGSSGRLQVVVFGNPDAMVFKDRLYGELRADICADCGHVELSVVNPQELYRHFRKSSE